jgi:hypothetical protein
MNAILAAAMLAAGTMGSPSPTLATYSYVHSLRPELPVSQAKRLVSLINFWAKRFEVSGRLLAAILKQESNFESGLKNCWTVQLKRGRTRFTCDLGIAQVNQLWIDKWHLNPDLLQNDDGYNIATAARILAWLKHYFPDDGWYGRYHSNTPSKKAAYIERLDGFLARG